MIYQLPLNLCLFLVFVDLVLLAWIIVLWKWKKWRTFSRVVALFLFSGFSILKLIFTTPSFGASSPNDLIFKSNKEIGKLFFAQKTDEGLLIFWEEKINGRERSLTFEMEGIYPTGLLIFREIDGKQLELRPNLEIERETWVPIIVEINDSQFQPISEQGKLALKNHKKPYWANYASHILSLAFLSTFLFTYFKKSNN